MLPKTTKDFIEYFWINFDKIRFLDYLDKDQKYDKLLLDILDISKDIFNNFEYNEQIGPPPHKSNFPLLAMISEIQLVAPNSVRKIAMESETINRAASLLENYPLKKRMVLRKHFLNRDCNFDEYRN